MSTDAYCLVEHNLIADIDTYGLLYNFNAVVDARNLSPEGWHVPTEAEWRTLINYLGGNDIAGGKMKDTESGLWQGSVPGSNNEVNFSAIPAGGRGRLGSASDLGYYATWWSSTSFDSSYAWHWGLYPDKNSIRCNPGHKASGFSVRCIKD
ncbi:fibrobacter succinogenes major paralogous domain-containing protein [Candidatus Neomarinimicrobiota bacterium]